MSLTLCEIAVLIDGALHGDDIEIFGASTIDGAQSGDITLVNDAKLLAELTASQAAAAIVTAEVQPEGIPYIVVEDVHAAFTKVLLLLRPPRAPRRVGVSPAAHVDPTAVLGDQVEIHPGAVVGEDVKIGDHVTIHSGVQVMAGCTIGQGSVLYPNVVLYEGVRIGRRVLIHGGAVIGANGFGYQMAAGQHVLSAQLGWVEIGDDVEIGAGTTIDRGTYGPTAIGNGTKIDNLVMIAHNCRIGRHNLLCSQVGIAGSSSTGDYVVMAGQVGVRDHVHIGDQVMLGAMAGVKDDLPASGRYLGAPAISERKQMVLHAAISKLPELRRQVKHLTRQLERLSPKVQDAA